MQVASVLTLPHNCVMAWVWVAPVATAVAGAVGVFFTWLAGKQGRTQTERLARRAEDLAEKARIRQEQRDAYFALLLYIRIELHRKRYKREGEQEKLAELTAKWPKGERVAMESDARIAVEIFGSPSALELLSKWISREDDSEYRMSQLYNEFVELVRHEFGIKPAHIRLEARDSLPTMPTEDSSTEDASTD